MQSRHRGADAERVEFAHYGLEGAVESLPRATQKSDEFLKRIGSTLAGAVAQLRVDGLRFTLAAWAGGDEYERQLADWCFDWFARQEGLRRLQPPTPARGAGRAARVRWLLEREPADIRYIAREAEALIERIKNMVIGYEQELKRGKAAV